MSLLCRFAFAATLLLPFFGPVATATDCSIAATAMQTASKLRGLRVRKSVPCKLQDRAQVERYLRETLRTKVPTERMENEGRAFKLLGLIPKDYHYMEGLISLYTSQLGGYYDPDKDYYAMAAWMPSMMQMPIAVHELTHALQDQHYDLSSLTDVTHETSDALMARSGLIEGDATAVMLDYARSLSGQRSIGDDENVSAFMVQNLTGAMLSSAMHEAPPALQAILIFPYMSGLHFAHSLLKKGGYSRIDQAFRNLPRSTEEILHPEQYLNGKRTSETLEAITPEGIALRAPTPVFADTLGEFVISTLLGGWIPTLRASSAAAGWGGDRVALYEKESGGQILTWNTKWDSAKDADEFLASLTEGYRKRFGASPETGTDGKLTFRDRDFGAIQITRTGSEAVRVVIGL